MMRGLEVVDNERIGLEGLDNKRKGILNNEMVGGFRY